MPERPLLIFPTPAVAGRAKMKTGFGSSNYHFPSPQMQKDKLTPRFESMIESFITDSTEGIEPEYVLVVRFIKSFTIKNIYGIVPSKTMEGLCQVKAEDQN